MKGAFLFTETEGIPSVLDMLKRLLRQLGHECRMTSSGNRKNGGTTTGWLKWVKFTVRQQPII